MKGHAEFPDRISRSAHACGIAGSADRAARIFAARRATSYHEATRQKSDKGPFKNFESSRCARIGEPAYVEDSLTGRECEAADNGETMARGKRRMASSRVPRTSAASLAMERHRSPALRSADTRTGRTRMADMGYRDNVMGPQPIAKIVKPPQSMIAAADAILSGSSPDAAARSSRRRMSRRARRCSRSRTR